MNWKSFGKRLLFPPAVFIWVLWPAAAALLVYSALTLDSAAPLSIASYVLSFYALMVIAVRVPAIIHWVKRFRRENKYAVRYASDARLRINLSLSVSFAFNAVYAAFQLGLGLWHQSVWFYAMAGYHLLLAAMRLVLVRYTGRHEPGEQKEMEWRKHRLCGALLLLITLILSIFVIYFIGRIRVFRHHEITTISMAAYTFASLTMAICNAVRYRRYGSPAWEAAKNISLASSIVSVLTLENAMLTAFGQESGEWFHQVMLGATGMAVFLAVQGIAIVMIVKAGRNLRPPASNITH